MSQIYNLYQYLVSVVVKKIKNYFILRSLKDIGLFVLEILIYYVRSDYLFLQILFCLIQIYYKFSEQYFLIIIRVVFPS